MPKKKRSPGNKKKSSSQFEDQKLGKHQSKGESKNLESGECAVSCEKTAEFSGDFPELSSQQRLLQTGYVLMIVAAIFLVNALEPDSKGNTAGIGFVTAIIGVGLFVYSRFIKKP